MSLLTLERDEDLTKLSSDTADPAPCRGLQGPGPSSTDDVGSGRGLNLVMAAIKRYIEDFGLYRAILSGFAHLMRVKQSGSRRKPCRLDCVAALSKIVRENSLTNLASDYFVPFRECQNTLGRSLRVVK